jgi:hypothetical protein
VQVLYRGSNYRFSNPAKVVAKYLVGEVPYLERPALFGQASDIFRNHWSRFCLDLFYVGV